MPRPPEPPESASALRQRAEQWAAARPAGEALPTSAQLVHELQVHQIELEMQNDELRRTQLALDAERARYFDLYDLAPVAYCTLSDAGLIVQANLGAATLLGVARGALVGQALTRFITHDDQDVFYRLRRQLAASGQAQACELRMLGGGGAPFWAQLSVIGQQEADGAPVLRLTLVDVSQRKASEQALRESESFAGAVFDSLASQIAVLDLQGRIVAVNEAWRAYGRRNGATPAAIDGVGLDYLAICRQAMLTEPDATTGPIVDGIRAVLAGEQARFQREYPCQAPDGLHWFRVTVSAVPGLRRGAVVSHMDITERKAYESQLHKVSLAVEQSPDSILITDVRSRIEYVNDAFVRITGFSRAEVMGRSPRLLSSGRTAPATFQAMWSAISQGQTWKGELHNRRKDGAEYVDSVIITPLRQPDGTITHYVSLQEDITARIRLDEELDQHRHHLEELVVSRTRELAAARQQADAANQAKSSFLANMSHEIRTPMTAILGLNHLMRRAGATREQSARLDKIDIAGRHLLALINDILDLSKIESGQLKLEDGDFNLVALVDNVASLIAEPLRAKGLVLSVDLGDVPTELHGDATRLRQALLNYASNAVKFTEHGTIALRATVLADGGDGLLLRFTVQDTGIGIAAEHLSRLFNAFLQADASTTRKYGGTGLGLAITDRLVRLMGGEVGVHSLPGVGSSFWFTVRLRRALGDLAVATATPTEDAETRLRQRHGGARILLVEDNAVNREVALEMLRFVGLAVDTATDGLEAVEQARARTYDLVLMDMQMPRLDGLGATRAIRALPGWAGCPIVALTANAFAEDRSACEAAGMNDFVAKPIELKALYETLLRWLPAAPGRAADTAPAAALLSAPPPLPDPAARAAPGLERLAAVPGFDASRGLDILRGDAAAYLRLLDLFLQMHSNDPARLAALLADGQRDKAMFLVHTLKGAAATVGADHLAEVADRLHRALQSPPPSDLPAAPLQAELDAIDNGLMALAAALPPPLAVAAAAPVASPDAATASRLVARLVGLLSRDDFDASALFECNADLLQAVFGAPCDELACLIRRYDFEAACSLLRSGAFDLPAEVQGPDVRRRTDRGPSGA